MRSTLGLDHRKLQLTNSNNLSSIYEDDVVEWCTRVVAHLTAYIAILVLLATIAFMVFKLLSDVDLGAGATETEPLRPRKTEAKLTYGTCGEDTECGNCNASASSSSSNNSINCATSEDLYDGKSCVICYDEQRNFFFVPCGHCATCYDCAKRIFYVETKTCPVCRRCIRKVRKLFAA